ncbi:MAG: hypothetical protein ACJ0FU_03390 [Gammaproteobacteria bacterium]|uniref:Uncharacterized protein n=1 Tax=SAR86 cluster bacterium TaxID=2030880 RepID=A0A368C7F3_9GAMM|nr:MAG: hypothetical protein DBW92_01035 [SAR86 cluster bacterium]
MSTNNDKYLVLRGKNKDIYFIQKRVSRKVSKLIGKDFIKKSLETSDILIARAKRDKILAELDSIEAMSTNNEDQINANEDIEMPNNEIEASNNLNKENINIKSNEKISLLEEYIDMEYIRSIKMPTKDYLIDIFDNNLLLVLVLTAIVVFFLLN